MARNRPRLGEIGRESGQEDEEHARNPKKALPVPENGILGVFFALLIYLGGRIFFEIPQIRQKALLHDFLAHMFSYMFLVFHFFVHLPNVPPGHGC